MNTSFKYYCSGSSLRKTCAILDWGPSPPLPPRCVWGWEWLQRPEEGRGRLLCVGALPHALALLLFVVMALVQQVADTSLACPAEPCSWWHAVHFPPLCSLGESYLPPSGWLVLTLSPPWLAGRFQPILVCRSPFLTVECPLAAGSSAFTVVSAPLRRQEGRSICRTVASLSLCIT